MKNEGTLTIKGITPQGNDAILTIKVVSFEDISKHLAKYINAGWFICKFSFTFL